MVSKPNTPHGLNWSQRARLGELQAVCNASVSNKRNLALHGMTLAAAKRALRYRQKQPNERNVERPVLLDYGSGTGRFVRFFDEQGYRVIGLDITREMLEEARRFGIPREALLAQFNGLSIPLLDESIDVVWICGVLKYTLFPPGAKSLHGNSEESTEPFEPTYIQVVRELYRVLKPGGIIANYEMYVDQPADVFTTAFEDAGFVCDRISIVRQYKGFLERGFEWKDCYGLPRSLIFLIAGAIAEFRFLFDNPRRPPRESTFRDYLFVWRKPNTITLGLNGPPR
jgi:SAM-dependent methyltransferase